MANTTFGVTALDAPVTFATSGVDASDGNSAVTAGWGIGSTFTADLLFEYGTMTTYMLSTDSATALAYAYSPNGPLDLGDGVYSGYFIGGAATIDNPAAHYASGSVNLIVEAFNGASYAASVGDGLWRGQSAVFSAVPATGLNTPTDLSFSGFTVTTVITPEPTTMALGILGGLSLLMLRRKQA